tara:strand:- start:48 stop:881 length:834 start_codon:yes stop_codon:yes gene_type:complete
VKVKKKLFVLGSLLVNLATSNHNFPDPHVTVGPTENAHMTTTTQNNNKFFFQDSREVFYSHKVNATKSLCIPCFDALLHQHFRKKKVHFDNKDKLRCPLFVRWEKDFIDSDTKFVRGLAGTMEPVDLEKIVDIAIKSASFGSDLAYYDIMEHELRRLRVIITIPNHFESISDYQDWQPALHGIKINFKNNIGKEYSAVFMPEDTECHKNESNEDIIRTVVSKSGFRGSLTLKLIQNSTMVRFQSSTAQLTFEEYRQFAKERSKAKKTTSTSKCKVKK